MDNPKSIGHISVLLKEVIDYLEVEPDKKYIDTTVGGGGHTEAILLSGGEVLGIDQDPTSLFKAENRLLACPRRFFRLVRGNFINLQSIASENKFNLVDGILMDLGFASFQVDDPDRGLSFTRNGPLDMRLDPSLGLTAADLINALPEQQLTKLFFEFGDEPRARLFAKRVIEYRKTKKIETTEELSEIITAGYLRGREKIHPATKVFQALRIAVNTELDNLKGALPQAFDLLKSGGRLVVISFHSGEDRIVKDYFRSLENECKGQILTKKPIVPSNEERENNPRSRSAKLRVIQKTNVRTNKKSSADQIHEISSKKG